MTAVRWHLTQSVEVTLAKDHSEKLCFHVFGSMTHQAILGHPWLEKHNPNFDWGKGKITSWGPFCQKNCLLKKTASSVSAKSDLSNVPQCYHELAEVFSKAKAKSLTLHRPYDCAIDLLPGATPP